MNGGLRKSALACVLCLYTLMAGASFNDDMNKFFGRLGYEQNTTTPKV